MTTTKTRYVFVAAAAALSLSLAACSGDSGDEGTTDTGGGEETSAEATDETEETTEETTEAAASGGAECLIGSWEITPEAAEEQVLALIGGEGEVDVSGTSTLSFDGTVYSALFDTEANLSIDVEGTTTEGSAISDGALEMEYTADDSTFTFGDVVAAEGGQTTTLAGESLEIPFEDSAAALSGTSQEYSCDGDELTVTVALPGVEGETSFDQVYTRTS